MKQSHRIFAPSPAPPFSKPILTQKQVVAHRENIRRSVFIKKAALSLGLTVCIAILPIARTFPFEMESCRTPHCKLVRYLKKSLKEMSPRVERALLAVDRKHFVDPDLPSYVMYEDIPLPIGFGETISAPHMHATGLQLLESHVIEGSRILDVGSGSGYLTAALAILGGKESFVLGIEKHKELAEKSLRNIKESNPELLEGPRPQIQILAGNALSEMLESQESFDAIHVGAAAASLPSLLVDKLSLGGRMVIPVGPRSTYQKLMCIDKAMDGEVYLRQLMQVRYVPLTDPVD